VPRYEYVCDVCGFREDQVRPISARDQADPCPACPRRQRKRCPGETVPDGFLRRDVVAGMKPHTDTGYQVPILSNSAGINPDQIPQMKRQFPHHEFHPDGRMIFTSHGHRERCLKDIGMYDKN
jgi:putative FmdB family regulatory protein